MYRLLLALSILLLPALSSGQVSSLSKRTLVRMGGPRTGNGLGDVMAAIDYKFVVCGDRVHFTYQLSPRMAYGGDDYGYEGKDYNWPEGERPPLLSLVLRTNFFPSRGTHPVLDANATADQALGSCQGRQSRPIGRVVDMVSRLVQGEPTVSDRQSVVDGLGMFGTTPAPPYRNDQFEERIRQLMPPAERKAAEATAELRKQERLTQQRRLETLERDERRTAEASLAAEEKARLAKVALAKPSADASTLSLVEEARMDAAVEAGRTRRRGEVAAGANACDTQWRSILTGTWDATAFGSAGTEFLKGVGSGSVEYAVISMNGTAYSRIVKWRGEPPKTISGTFRIDANPTAEIVDGTRCGVYVSYSDNSKGTDAVQWRWADGVVLTHDPKGWTIRMKKR